METKEQKRLPWNPLLAVAFAVATYYVAAYIIGALLSVILLAMGWDSDRITDAFSGGSVPVQFFYVLLYEALTVGFLLLFLRLYKSSVRALGFIKPKPIHFAYGAASYLFYFVAFVAVAVAVKYFVPGFDQNQEQELGFNNVVGVLPLLMTFISLVVLPPLVEELIFRGLLFTSFRAKTGFWLAALITSFIFAVAHLPEGGSGGPLYIAALDTFILSLMLCFLREKTGNLWAGITLHVIKNGVAFISIFIYATH